MADFKLTLVTDANNPTVGDLFLDNGTVRLTNSLAEEVAQIIWIRLHFFKGEWFLDPLQGTPYLQTILGQKVPLATITQLFKNIITNTPGVKVITSFSTSLKQRQLTLTFSCLLNDGTTLTSADFGDFIVGVA